MKNKYNSLPVNSNCKIWRYSFFNIILLCIIILSFACSGKQVDGPGMNFEKELYDFGTVNEGESVEYTFKFKNDGTEILIIEDVKPTCGCTITGEYNPEVEPGASGEIPVELRTDGFPGKMSKIIRVLTNIPDKQEIVLTLQGIVYTPISVNPKLLWVLPKKTTPVSLSGSFTIMNNTDNPLEILPITPSQKNVTAGIIIVKENKEFQIEVTVNPPFNHDRTEEMLKIQTNIPEKEYITLRYAYYLHAKVVVYPQPVILEPGVLNTNFERIINIDNYFSGPISIINPHVTGGTLEYKIEEPVEGKNYQIKLLFPAGFVLKEDDILVLNFQVKKGQVSLEYNIPIEISESSR